MQMQKTRYIPAGAVKVTDKLSDAVAYLYHFGAQPCARIFYGKQGKPIVAYRFRSFADREKTVRQYFEGRRASMKATAARTAERHAWVNTFKVGDILNTCWGYDQTNREYFEVTGVKTKMVELTEIDCESRSGGTQSMTEYAVPLAGAFKARAKPIWRRAQKGGVRIDQCRWATLTEFKEPVPGVKVYNEGYVSHYA